VIDEQTNQVQTTIPVGANPKGIAVAEGRVWVANTDDDTVSVIDASSGEEERTIDVADEPRGAIAAFDSVWVASGGQAVTRIDPKTAQVAQEVSVEGSPEEIAATAPDADGGPAIWVSGGDGETISKIEVEVE